MRRTKTSTQATPLSSRNHLGGAFRWRSFGVGDCKDRAVAPGDAPAVGGDIADHLRRLRLAATAMRGPMLPPDLDATSTAHKELADGPGLANDALGDPVYATYGHIERLWLVVDDLLRGVETLLPPVEVSWFAHLPVVRSSVECLSRLWWLTERPIGPVRRVVRFFNERLAEIQHSFDVLDKSADALPDDLITRAREEQHAKRRELTDWATAQGVRNPGGFLGDEGRPKPTQLLASLYQHEAEDFGAGILGLWHYSELSAVAHGLPDGMDRYPVVGAIEHRENRMLLDTEDLAKAVMPLIDVHDAAVMRSAALFRWPMAGDYQAERLATRMYVNRASGVV